MIIAIPNKNYSITELYNTVASLMGKETESLQYDCRNINVASNIQDGFFAYYRESNPYMSESDFKMSMGMLLLSYGPKVDENLADNEVEVFDGFIC
jgi:hypothetical protein